MRGRAAFHSNRQPLAPSLMITWRTPRDCEFSGDRWASSTLSLRGSADPEQRGLALIRRQHVHELQQLRRQLYSGAGAGSSITSSPPPAAAVSLAPASVVGNGTSSCNNAKRAPRSNGASAVMSPGVNDRWRRTPPQWSSRRTPRSGSGQRRWDRRPRGRPRTTACGHQIGDHLPAEIVVTHPTQHGRGTPRRRVSRRHRPDWRPCRRGGMEVRSQEGLAGLRQARPERGNIHVKTTQNDDRRPCQPPAEYASDTSAMAAMKNTNMSTRFTRAAVPAPRNSCHTNTPQQGGHHGRGLTDGVGNRHPR